MKRALPALTVTAGLLMANSAAACPPSETDLVIVGGIVLTTGLVVLSGISVIGIAIWRAVRRRVQARAHIVPLG
jgi:hypothetical protein